MKNHQQTVKASLDRGLAYLLSVQRSDGGFDSFSSPSATHFEKVFTYQTTFAPALMLAALSDQQTPLSHRLTRHLASFVRKQKSPLWSFNYWTKLSPERRRQPYPDDLDDTCCALIGLMRYDASSIGPAALAAIVKLLLASEVQPGGPYRTWLAPPNSSKAWQDIDLAVNANISYLLSLISQPLPNITDFMEQAIRDEQLSSPYYPSSHPLVYYLARAYEGPLLGQLAISAQHLRAKDDLLPPLKNALLLTSLIRLGEIDIASLAERLLDDQQTDGSWPAEAFCLDPARDGITYYNGSESLTTAFVLEALQLYSQTAHATKTATKGKLTNATTLKPQHKGSDRTDSIFRSAVLAGVRHDTRDLEIELHNSTLDFTNRLARSNNGSEIVALPLQFNQSLRVPLDKASHPRLVQLGIANLYGWAAYTIYDDFLDDEGQPPLLPVATTALRYSLSAFVRALPEDEAFQDFVKQTFDTIDGANAWEISQCRFQCSNQQVVIKQLPDYSEPTRLADRSLGHSLTPLAVLRASGVSVDSKLFRGVHQAIVHYLTARQLNDDAHDWQIDLQNGHITYVVARILADEQVKPGSYALNALLKRAERRFWHHTLTDICRLMKQQTALGRRSLRNLPELQHHNAITELLDGIDASVAETLATQDQAQNFLKHYKQGRQVAII